MSDLIDREDAIKALKGLPIYWADEEALLEPKDAISAIENLPSAEPKRGKWLLKEPRGVWTHMYQCSECGYTVLSCEVDKPDFCSHCGADMRGEE